MASLPGKSSLTEAELAKIRRLKSESKPRAISPETYFIAKLGFFYGYEAIRAYSSGELPRESAEELLRATEMLSSEYTYRNALAVFYSTKDGKSFNSGMKTFTNRINIDE